MGKEGMTIGVRATNATARPEMLPEALVEALLGAWTRGVLPARWHGLARTWISLADDGLVTLEARADAVTFWLMTSVGWSRSLAAHWIEVALIACRGRFEAALERVGYELDLARVPSLDDVLTPRRHSFFEGDGGVGVADGDEVRWEVRDGRYEQPATPIRALSEAARAELDAVNKTRRCRCAACQTALFRWAPDNVVSAGQRVTKVATFAARSMEALEQRPDGCVLAMSSTVDGDRTVQAPRLAGPWRALPAAVATQPNCAVLGVGQKFALYAQSATGACTVSHSSDGGKSWSAPRAVPAFGKSKKLRWFRTPDDAVVYAAAQPAKGLFRSTDGGVTFAAMPGGIAVEGKVPSSVLSLTTWRGALFAVVELRGGKLRLVRSADDGASWSVLPLPLERIPHAVFATPDALVCIADSHSASPPYTSWIASLVSVDSGASFEVRGAVEGMFEHAAHGARGIVLAVRRDTSSGLSVLLHSRDGAVWNEVVRCGARGVFASNVDAADGYFFSNLTLWSFKRKA